MLFFSALESFEIYYYGSYNIVTFMNNMVEVFIILLIFYWTKFYYFTFKLLPSKGLQSYFEALYKFLGQLFFSLVPQKGLKFFVLILFMFLFILHLNLYGLLPFGFTVTAHIFLPIFLSFSFNLGFFLLGILNYKLKFFKLFIPKGVPFFLIFFVALIEFISYLVRPFSLCIRLFANMLAGHILMHIIVAFAVAFLYVVDNPFFDIIYLFFFIFSASILVFVLCLEFSVACIQAFVFFLLLSIYLKDSFFLK